MQNQETLKRARPMSGTAETKISLLEWIDRGRASWEVLLADVGDERMEEPGAVDDWTFRDVAAHLNAWREWSLARLEAAGTGKEPLPPWPAEMNEENAEGVDELNAWFFERARNRAVREVIAESREQFRQMRAAVEALSPEELSEPGHFAWAADYPLSAVVEGSLEHLEEHEQMTREWLARER
jgi:hypothetical protein